MDFYDLHHYEYPECVYKYKIMKIQWKMNAGTTTRNCPRSPRFRIWPMPNPKARTSYFAQIIHRYYPRGPKFSCFFNSLFDWPEFGRQL